MRRLLVVCAVVLAALGTGAWALLGTGSYTVTVVLASATNVVRGGSVVVNGMQAGTVRDISVDGGKAKVALDLDRRYAPLHDGAVVRIEWKALLGERRVAVTDGPKANPTIPSGGLIPGTMPAPMEFDQVLNALDQPTRDHLASLINELNGTTQGNEAHLNQTLRTAGPALQALGDVLRGLGTDGPAIKQLVTQLDVLVRTLSSRDADITNVIDQLSRTTALTAQQRQALTQALQKLPGTLQTATSTLGDIPGSVRQTLPLLENLRPATDQLPEVARNLSPVLRDLRPAAAQLRPTLAAASVLLNYTPGLLDTAHGVLPGANAAVKNLMPALDFLRPYTPELAGLLSNWGSASANYDANGHYARIYIQSGAGNANVNPGVMPPGYHGDPYPMPGGPANQPWTDAFGSELR